MGLCPYCKEELHIKDFFDKEGQGIINISYECKQETINVTHFGVARMWVCPHCDMILGFTEFKKGS